ITGSLTTLDESNLGLLDRLKPLKTKVMAGFGIQKAEQVRVLAPHCDAVVVGSAIVRAVTEAYNQGDRARNAARLIIEDLLK
ncbi:MAG: tryptophan synthase subunit alpha, partial [Spirochaetales bacterium]|nr:tryptophan synthase subunit alpha [Spirochaetales bacterium]